MNKYSKAFSLIELLLAMTISAALMLCLFHTLSTYLNLWRSSSADTIRLQDATFVLNRIVQDVYTASEINPTSNNDQLDLGFAGYSLSYDFYGDKLRRRKNGGGASYFTDENVIYGLNFDYLSAKRVSITVEILQGRRPKPLLITAEAGVRL